MDDLQQDQENIREYLDENVFDQILRQYQHQGLTDHSITAYTRMASQGCQLLHPLLPKLPTQKGSRFISQSELVNLDKTLLSRIESRQKFLTHREYRNNSQGQLSGVIEKSISILDDNSCLKDKIAFQLDHNKTQLKYQEEQCKNELQKTQIVRSRSSAFKKLPKIKTYPAKIDEEGQIMPAIKAKIIQVAQPEIQFTIPTHYVYWIDSFFGKWRPPMREGASLTNVQGKYYLIGGISSSPFNDIVLWNYNEWQYIQTIGEKSPFGRTNHVHCIYRRQIYIFGGEKPYDSGQKRRESTNDFRLFNTENNEIKNIRYGGELIEGRRGASGALVGKYILIQGGITTLGRYLNDLYHYDISNNKMYLSFVEQNDFFNNGIAFHTLIPVFSQQRTIQIYKNYMDPEELKEFKIKIEGVYLFGGENKEGKLYSNLYMLNPCQKPMQWSCVSTKGIGPCSRYKHTANYCERQGVIIIYGGIDQNSQFLSDCHIFKIETQCWCIVDIQQKQGRAGHCSVIDDHKLMIFGGYNEYGFVSAEFSILEIDSLIALRCRRENVVSNHFTTVHKQKTETTIKQDQTDRISKIREQVANLSYNYKSFIPKPIIKQISNRNLSKNNKDMVLLQQKFNDETQDLIKDFDYVEEQQGIDMKASSDMKSSGKYESTPISMKKSLGVRQASIKNLNGFLH